MANKAVYQQFVMNWTKMQSWAKANNIPTTALEPVYKMDAQRVLNGQTPMGAGERYRAVKAAADTNSVITPGPATHTTPSLSPSNLFGNIQNNLSQIFLGLNPIGLVKGAVDTVLHTIEHPETTIKPLVTKKAMITLATHPTKSILSWLPGITDLGELAKGKSGLDNLSTHPVSALLDIMPIDRVPDIALYGEAGDRIAAKLSTTPEALRAVKGSPGIKALARLAATKEVKRAPMSIAQDEAGNYIRVTSSLETWWHTFTRRHHFGAEASTMSYQAFEVGQAKTNEAERLLMPLDKQMQMLNTADRLSVLRTLTLSGMSYADVASAHTATLITGEEIPLTGAIKKAIALYEPVEHWFGEQGLGSSHLTKLRMPTGQEEIYSATIGNQLQSYLDASNKAAAKVAEARSILEPLTTQAHALDVNIDQRMMILDKIRSDTWESITATIPGTQSDINDMLRQSLTPSTRWNTMGTFKKDAVKRVYSGDDPRWHSPEVKEVFKSPVARQLFGLDKGNAANVTSTRDILKSHAKVLNDIFSPGGLIDELKHYRSEGDHAGFTRTVNKINRRLTGRFAMEMKVSNNPQLFDNLRQLTNDLGSLGSERNKLERDIADKTAGLSKRSKKDSLQGRIAAYEKAKDKVTDYIWEKPGYSDELHIPARYQPVYEQVYARMLGDHEKAQLVAQEGYQKLAEHGYTDEELAKLRTTPTRIFEMISTFAKSTFNDPFLSGAYLGVKEEVMRSAITEVRDIYARRDIENNPDFVVHYVPKITPFEMKDEGFDYYNVFIPTARIPKPSQVFNRTWHFGSTVHNFMAGVSHAVKTQLMHDGALEFVTQAVKRGYDKDKMDAMIATDPEYRRRFSGMEGDPTFNVGAVRNQIYKELGLMEWDPQGIFNIKLPRGVGSSQTVLMPIDLIKTIEKITDTTQFPMEHTYDKATSLFRFSILALSPRYTAHILFGGTYLVALRLRNPASLITMLGHAYKAAKGGYLQQDLQDKLFTQMTQFGNADVTFHYRSGVSMGRIMTEEQLTHMGINPKYASAVDKLNAVAHINYKFTHYVANMQRAMVFFDAIPKGITDVTDEEGNVVKNVSSDRALYLGLQAVEKVMGDVRRMSPFERQVMTRIMPFYGWTKHVLKYVMSYPFDHPLRASILAGIALHNTESITKGLDMRTQLLFFLGQPTKEGTVSAVTVRALDPLRTTANYASLAGWLSSLNPVFTSAFGSVDPNINFGTNELYPTISYNNIYGVEQANAQNNPIVTTIEQYVPETSALADYMGLGQYRHLRKNDPSAFWKTMYESLNVPFAQVQHINLKQKAVKDEDARYQQAKAAAQKAFQTGTFNVIKDYKTLPYPLNDVYNITPIQLQAMYDASMQKYGLSPMETMIPPKSPPGL